MIYLQKINKWFDNVHALNSIDIHIAKEKSTLIIGGNGSGKSTLSKILSGDISPSSGKIIVDGKTYSSLNHKQALELGISEVYQDFSLDNQRNIYENIFMGREITHPFGILNKKEMIDKTKKLYEKIGVKPPNLKTKVRYLSGGQRQMVSILKVLGKQTKVIIFDEPTASLGVEETKQVEKIIQNLKKDKKTIIIISHDINQIYGLADNIIELKSGNLVGEYTLSEYEEISKGGIYER